MQVSQLKNLGHITMSSAVAGWGTASAAVATATALENKLSSIGQDILPAVESPYSNFLLGTGVVFVIGGYVLHRHYQKQISQMDEHCCCAKKEVLTNLRTLTRILIVAGLAISAHSLMNKTR